MQVFTIIDDRSAPTAYTYQVRLPAGGSIQLVDGGLLVFLDDEGAFLGGAAPAWARDAAGKAVLTRYVVDGDTFTQVVDHTGAGIAYPVVADPWLEQELYWAPWVSGDTSRWKVNVKPPAWAEQWAGVAIWWAHRDEVVSKLAKLGYASWRWNNSIQEQFYCYIAGLPLPKPTFNMESWRVNWNWSTIAQYNCNYPEGGWGSVY